MHNLRMWEFVPVLSPSDHAFLIIDQCRPVPILDRGGGGVIGEKGGKGGEGENLSLLRFYSKGVNCLSQAKKFPRTQAIRRIRPITGAYLWTQAKLNRMVASISGYSIAFFIFFPGTSRTAAPVNEM